MQTNSIDSNLLRLFSAFKGITFNPAIHQYTFNETGTIANSVTGLLKKYTPPFDGENISRRYAEKHNITVEEVRNLWGVKNVCSTVKGSLIHYFIECYFRSTFYDLTAKSTKDKVYNDFLESMTKKARQDKFTFTGDAEQLVDKLLLEAAYVVNNHVKNYLRDSAALTPVGVELILGDESLELCGSPDMIAYAPKTGGLIIQDWKTNGAAIDEPNTFNKFIVIDKWKIPYTKLHEYSLQLSFYAGILRRKGIEVDSNGWLIHFSDINPNYLLHKCVDYSEVVEWVFAELEQKFAWKQKKLN
jgi:hypothetical protein